MSSMICRITKENTLDGGTTFLIGMYNTMDEVVAEKAVDMWECREVIIDKSTMIYFSDRATAEFLHEKYSKRERK